ncbi:hypothetical protein [Vibrio sp. T20]|uniref:hypothetical protein n=1 Tax=Vibrio sp. T20 TaxID=2588450 RepID=UPI0011B42031|nr:hypothetical protein [Vibrio sp. T20]
MKRMILASLIGLIASGAYASDLSYGGPYSQMKLKLCSDTPPSRSILPDGSLVCDGEDNDPNAYCVGGFNYADTDIFNCGSQVDQDGDLNNNGRPDDEEDWDGDGLANGVDPNPTLNDNVEIDEDKNGIPDRLEPFFERYKASRAEVIECDAQDPNCKSSNTAIYSLANMNRDLTNIVNLMASTTNVDKKFQRTLTNLSQTLAYQEAETRRELRDLQHAVNNSGGGGVDNSNLIKSEFRDVDSQFADLESNLNNVHRTVNNVGAQLYTINRGVETLSSDLNTNSQDILSAINNLEVSGSGLTSQQQTQLKNAAKANANQKLLKQIQQRVNGYGSGFDMIIDGNDEIKSAVQQNALMISSVSDDVNENTNQKFNQLSDQIAAISGGQSTVDLSGVESSIDALSDKIDGIEGGGNGEGLAEISSKLDGLATGVTDIGDLLKGVDASKAGIDGTCIQGGTCQGFYESAYEGDLSTVVGSQLDSMKTSIVDPFVSSFGNIDLSGAQRPKFGLPVPFYGYMSFDDYIDMDWIFGFLRFIFLASTAFYCRQIIFGG